MAYQPKSYKKFVATAATATLVASAIVPVAFADNASTASFTDVSDRYKDAVEYLVANNLSKGLTETSYGVETTIKRGDAAIILAAALGLNDDENAAASGFTDVPTRAALAINSLKAAGIIKGKTATRFGFEDNLKRGEVALIMANVNAYNLKGDASKLAFTDVKEVYKEAVAGLLEAGITEGKTSTRFGTDDAIKRGEFALFVYRAEKGNVVDPIVGDYQLQVSTAKTSLVANGADNTVVTVKIVDKNGVVATNADDIVLAFDATFGSLANNRVTVQDGVATVVLTSEFSQKDLKSVVTARLIETADGSEWYDQIGLVNSTVIDFVPASGSVDVNNMPLVTGAESNEADRVTVYFDRNVTPAMFYSKTNPISLSVSQTNEFKDIAGYIAVPGNAKAIEVILEKDTVLTDNKTVNVDQFVTTDDNFNVISKSFILTDARQPEATSVKQLAYNKLEVTFSEPISDVQASQLLIDGGQVAILDVTNGEFDATNGLDKRNTLVVTTEKFIPSGNHSIQLSGISDFAGESDPANISSNQILNFSVPGSSTVPAATVTVESPEQVRLQFNTYVEGFEAADVSFEWYNEETKKWDKKADIFTAVENVDGDGQEFVYEMAEDWTEYFSTETTNDNYFNHKFRVVIEEDTFENPANGKDNSLQELSLNYTGSPLNNPDNTSPSISGTPTVVTDKNMYEGNYVVTFNEPVKLKDEDDSDTIQDLNTPSELQSSNSTGLPNVVVEFIGTDKDGKKKTVAGSVVDYVNSMDNSFYVNTNEAKELQKLVDAGYSEEWQLVVRNVTDDVGNAATTLTSNVTVKRSAPAAAADFKVYDNTYDGVSFLSSNDSMDQIVLDFTSAVTYTGTTENALNLSNYTLNGAKLPNGSIARLFDGDGSEANGFELVVIEVPNNTLLQGSNTINISKSLKSAKGLALTGQTEVAEDLDQDILTAN